MSVKEKLEAYRHKKRREEKIKSITSVIKYIFFWRGRNKNEQILKESTSNEQVKLLEESEDKKEHKQEKDIQEESIQDILEEDNAQESQNTVLKLVIYLLYFLLWVTLYIIALEYEFGAVYFILSALVFIYWNTRSGPKLRGELSAYSVFNPNCEAIEGTLDASQFEMELRYGGLR